jgi:hypothetical protein
VVYFPTHLFFSRLFRPPESPAQNGRRDDR